MLQRSWIRRLTLLGVVAGFVLVPTAAQADPSFYKTPLFGSTTTPNGTLLVADAGQGIVNGDTGALVASLPGVTDVASNSFAGGLWAITGGGPGVEDQQFLYQVDGSGNVTQKADLWAFEEENNPHPAAADSNPFDVADFGRGRALVADAGGNTIIRVERFGRVKLVAVLPDELVSTDNIKKLAGCPSPAPFCGLPPMMPAQPVATSVAVGPDGWIYAGELKGFPAPTGESKIWRIRPNAENVQCGTHFGRCEVAFDGFTSIIDLAFGPDGKLYVAQFDDASWAAIEIFGGSGALGGSVHACDLATKDCDEVASGLPMLTSIAFRNDGSLWGTKWSLVPGLADAVQILP